MASPVEAGSYLASASSNNNDVVSSSSSTVNIQQLQIIRQTQNIDVRMKRHPELQPYVPSERDRFIVVQGNRRPISTSRRPNQGPTSNTSNVTKPKKCVSMTRLDQLAQPKRLFTKTATTNSNATNNNHNNNHNKLLIPDPSVTFESSDDSLKFSTPSVEPKAKAENGRHDQEHEKRLKAKEEEERVKAQEEERLKAEEEKRLKAHGEEKRLRAEEEKRLKAEEEKRLKAEEEKRLEAEEEERLKAEEEKRLKAEEELREVARREEEERQSRQLKLESILAKVNGSF